MPKLMKANEVADYLGVSKKTVYRLSQTGRLGHVEVGTAHRWTPELVDDYINRSTKKASRPKTGSIR